MRWHFRTLNGRTDSPISRPRLEEMLRVGWAPANRNGERRATGYGFYNNDGKTFVGHGGYCSGYRSFMALHLETGTGVTALINVNDASPYDLAFGVHQIMIGAKNSAALSDHPQSETDLAKYTGTYDRWGMPERVRIETDGEKLIMVNLFAENPGRSMMTYIPIGGHRFHAEHDEAEEVEFDMGVDGRADRFWQYPTSHYLSRVD